MKLSALVLAATFALALPASAWADLVAEPPPTPASDPPPASSSEPSTSETASTEPANSGAADGDPTSSVSGPPKGGCASCAVGRSSSTDAMIAMIVSALTASLALERRRRGRAVG